MSSHLVSRNVVIAATRTSMRLEPEFWSALAEIAQRERTTIARLVAGAHTQEPGASRTSAARVLALRYFRRVAGGATEGGGGRSAQA